MPWVSPIVTFTLGAASAFRTVPFANGVSDALNRTVFGADLALEPVGFFHIAQSCELTCRFSLLTVKSLMYF